MCTCNQWRIYRILKRWFPLVVDHRCRGLGAQPPAAEEVLIFKSIQSIESYNFYTLDRGGSRISERGG